MHHFPKYNDCFFFVIKVFQVRCAAHSLQLLMEELYKVHPMNEACRLGESILTHFKDVDEAAKLEAVQKAAGQVACVCFALVFFFA